MTNIYGTTPCITTMQLTTKEVIREPIAIATAAAVLEMKVCHRVT